MSMMLMFVSLTLSVLLLAVANANAASWKPSMCRPGREEGDSIVLEASCLPEGMEVRWTSASSEVEWIQVEYQCRNLSTENVQFEEKSILLPVSRTTTGSNVLPLPLASMECILSGCYQEGWFQRYALAPATCTCSQVTQDDQIPIYDEIQVEVDTVDISATTTLPLLSPSPLDHMPLPTSTTPQSNTPATHTSLVHTITASSTQRPSTGISTTRTATSDLNTVFTYTPTSTSTPFTAVSVTETTMSRNGAMSSPSSSPQASPTIPPSGAVEREILVTASTAFIFCLVASVVIIVGVLLLLRRRKIVVKHTALTSDVENGKEAGYGLVATSGILPQDGKTVECNC